MSTLTNAAIAVKNNPSNQNIVALVNASAKVGQDVGFGGTMNWRKVIWDVKSALTGGTEPVETEPEVEVEVVPEPVVPEPEPTPEPEPEPDVEPVDEEDN